MRSPSALATELRSQGRKVTPQRVAIFEALEGNSDHPSAEGVHETVQATMPMVSLRTVYQALNDLVSMGEIRQLEPGLGPSRFDPNTEPHGHLVCRVCGLVQDVSPVSIPAQPPSGELGGFEVEETETIYRGRCSACGPTTGTAA